MSADWAGAVAADSSTVHCDESNVDARQLCTPSRMLRVARSHSGRINVALAERIDGHLKPRAVLDVSADWATNVTSGDALAAAQ